MHEHSKITTAKTKFKINMKHVLSINNIGLGDQIRTLHDVSAYEK